MDGWLGVFNYRHLCTEAPRRRPKADDRLTKHQGVSETPKNADVICEQPLGGWHVWLPPFWTSLSLQNFPAVQHTAVTAPLPPHFVTEILLLLQINIRRNWRKSRQISVHTWQSTALQMEETLHCCRSLWHLNKGVNEFSSGSLQTKPPVDDGFAGKHPNFKWRDHF